MSKIGQAVPELCHGHFSRHHSLCTCHVQVIIQKDRGHLDSRQKGCSYPPKTACETDLRLQRYKLVKSVMGPCRVCRVGPLILRFFFETTENSLRASRSLVNTDAELSLKTPKSFLRAVAKVSPSLGVEWRFWNRLMCVIWLPKLSWFSARPPGQSHLSLKHSIL